MTILTLLLLLTTLFFFWWGVPPILRVIQIFQRPDFVYFDKLNILRLIAVTMMISATVLCGVASASCWQFRWRRSVTALFTGTFLLVLGSVIVHAYGL